MVQTVNDAGRTTAHRSPTSVAGDNRAVAASLIAQNSSRAGIDYAGLRDSVELTKLLRPDIAASLDRAVTSSLSVVQQGDYARIAESAAPATTSPAAFSFTAASPTSRAASNGPSTATLIADLTQMTLDLTGIVDPTPISDGSNAVISVGRSIGALFSGDLGGAGGHLANGAISVVGFIPGLGDLAKAGKIGKWAETVANAVTAASRSPAARASLEPVLRQVADLLDKLPQGMIDKLPTGARESLERLKGELDRIFSPNALTLDSAGRAIVRNADGTLDLSAASRAYADAVASNRPWSWADNFSGTMTAGERSTIRREAISRGLVPDVPMKPGTRYADFAAAGLVQRTDSLPRDLWLRGDPAQFAWLDARIPGGRPAGTTWHHTETPGRMELVPFGAHNVNSHIGGRSPGHWAHAAR